MIKKRIKGLLALILICLSLTLTAETLKKVSLLEYIEIVSYTTNTPIYIDKDIDVSISFFIPTDIKPLNLLETLSETLKSNDLKLKRLRDIYIVTKPKPKNYYKYKFKHINPLDVNATLSVFEDLNYSYLSSSNTVIYSSNQDTHYKIQDFLNVIDLPKRQKKIKLTIFTTNINKLKEIGSKVDSLEIGLNNYVTSVLNQEQTSTSYNFSNALAFKATLSYLQNNGVTTINQSPTITLQDKEISSVSFVDNVPYQVSTTSIQDGQSTTQETTEYKDVGLKIQIKPNIFEDYTFLDLNLVNESLKSTGDKPTTQKIQYKQKFKLNSDEILLLTGLNTHTTSNKTQKIPLLGDLPLLEYIFKFESTIETTNIISIMVEHIQ